MGQQMPVMLKCKLCYQKDMEEQWRRMKEVLYYFPELRTYKATKHQLSPPNELKFYFSSALYHITKIDSQPHIISPIFKIFVSFWCKLHQNKCCLWFTKFPFYDSFIHLFPDINKGKQRTCGENLFVKYWELCYRPSVQLTRFIPFVGFWVRVWRHSDTLLEYHSLFSTFRVMCQLPGVF